MAEARKAMLELAKAMREMTCIHPEAEQMIWDLSRQLGQVGGKKTYGYLPKPMKKLVDEIVDQMARLPTVDACYQTWWELQCQVEDYYSEDKKRIRPPLSQQKEFRQTKNAVIKESLLERLSSYNILNNLIPGAFFVFFGKLLNVISLPLDGVVERIFVYYFCGMIISRIGSLVIEGIFEKVKWIKYVPKAEYVAAVKKDARIESLLETSNMYRTCAGLFLTLGIVKGYSTLVELLAIPGCVTAWLVVILLFILFSASFVKQTRHIASRVDAANKSTEGE